MATSKFFLLLAALPCLLHPQTTVTLTTTPNPSTFGAAVTLTATVTPATAAGKVTFYDGVTVLGTKPLVSGVAQISTIALPAGSRKVRAYYTGATSNVVTEVVQAVGSAGLVARSLLSPPVAAVFAVGDFNGDGKPDLVINDGTANTIGVLLANGNGSFQTAHVNANLGPGFTAGVVAVADFNGDGKADIVATTSSGNSLAIVLGNGDGTFETPLIIPFPGPGSVSVGDFNGDGKADLLVLNGGGIGILPGNGDGTFQSPIAAVPATISSVVIGDFNGDGKPDLAFYDLSVNSVRILLGKGDGTFQQAASYPLQSVIGLASGDFNSDGKADLAITVNSNQNSQVNILLGNGDGTFQTGMSYSAAGQGRSPSVGDFNGDGNADLVLSGNPVNVLLGNGDGTFQPPVTYATAFNASSLIVGDFNGDGRTDLVLADGNFLLGTTVSVTPAGTPQSTVAGSPFPTQLQVTVKDGANPISGVAVTFAAPSSGPSAVLSSTIAMTDANGVATVTATANTQTGRYTVTATATALGVSAAFALTNLAGPPSVITASPTLPESTVVGTAFPKPLAVTLADSTGLPASGVTVTFSAPASGASAVLSSGTAVTNASGVASVTATANNIPGAYTVTARAGGLSATFSLSNVQPATVSLASSANPSTFGAPLTLTATVSSPAAIGHVTFFDGVNILGSAPVSSGIASISTILLPAGSRKLTTYYSGDANYIAATSNVLTQTVKAVAGGALVAQSPLTLPAVPTSVAVGDFNGDGKPDFAFPSQDSVSWWQVDLGASSSIGSIVIWGRTDCCVNRLSDYWIFVSNTPFLPTDTPATLQNRAGTFSSHQTGISSIPFPSATIAVNGAVGRYVRVQLSNPGFLSLAEVQVFGTGAPATNLALGKAASQSSTYPGYPSAATGSAVDGNTDGNFFDGSVTSTGLGFVTIMLGKGDGTFQSPVNYAIGEAGGLIVTGDFNRDGIADLALTTASTSQIDGVTRGILTTLLGNGDGTFGPGVDYPVVSVTGLPVLGFDPMGVGDFNGDGKADILIASSAYAGSGVEIGGLTLLLGNGDGSFQGPMSYAGAASNFVVADFNGDGKADLAVEDALLQTDSILLGNGDGTHQAAINLSTNGKFVTGDFNGDGKTDLAASGFTFISGNPIASTLILLGNGDGTFQTSVGYPFGTPVTSGDFNGDGIADLVLVDSSGDLSGVLYGNGDGTFHQGIQLAAGAPLAVADFNGDGRADILTLSPTGGVTVLLGATGAAISLTATGGTPQSAATGAAFAQPLQVTVLNGGSPVAGATVTFTVPTVGASATLASNTAVTNSSGVASVAATANSVAGSYAVTASYNGVNAAFSLTNTAYAFLVATGGTPQSTAVGTPFATALQATVKNALGSPVSGVTVTFAAPTVGATALLSNTTAVTNAAGIASVSATANNIGGSYAVTATVGTLSTSFSLTNTGGQAAGIAATGGTPQSAPLGAAFASPLQATVKDGSGNPLAGITVTFAAPTVGATALLSNTTAVTNAAGIASVTATANLIAGSYSVTASVGTASTSFSLTNVPGASGDLAAGKTATQSSTLPGYSTAGAGSAVDGNTDGQFFDGSVTATNQDANPWWQVDLGASSAVSSVVIWNRTDCCASRLSDYWIFISDTPFLASDTPATLQNRAATFASHQTTAPNPSATIAAAAQGRYVRVELSSAGYLSLAEVQVFGGGGGPPPPTNLAQGKAATQSSTLPGYAGAGAGSAADGNTDGSFYDGSVTATNADSNAWWQVDLGAPSAVNSVVVWNRTDCCGSRLSDYWVFVSNTPFLASDTPATLANRAGTFASHQTAAPNPSTTILVGMQGRYVRVQLSDTDYLSLAEVQVLGTGPPSSNLAQGKAASQSSTLPGYADGAAAAVDGNTDGNFYDGSVTATNQDANPWWQVDLGASAAVSSVAIYNRTDCCGSRLSDYWVFISDTPFLASDTPATLQNRAGTFASHQTTAPNPSTALAPGAEGRYVRVQLTSAGYLSLAEVQVFGQ